MSDAVPPVVVGDRERRPPADLQRLYRTKTACGFDQASQAYQKTAPICCRDCQMNWLLLELGGLRTRCARLEEDVEFWKGSHGPIIAPYLERAEVAEARVLELEAGLATVRKGLG